jgi:hypothetical protein
MDKVQKHNSFNTNTPSSESYRNYGGLFSLLLLLLLLLLLVVVVVVVVVQGPFEKFVDSPHYSESELCGGAVTVSFSKYLPWQVTHFLQRSTQFSKTCCRPLSTSKFLACLGAPLSWLEKPRNRMGGDLDCMADVLTELHRSTFSKPNIEFNSDLAP